MYANLLVGYHALSAVDRTPIILTGYHALVSPVRHQLVGQHRLSAIAQPQPDPSAVGVYLSGGTSNTDIAQSYGGRISTQEFDFQQFTQVSSLPGVTVVRVGNSSLGDAVLRYEKEGNRFIFWWIPSGSGDYSARIITGDGQYGVLSAEGVGNGFVVVDIDYGSLDPQGAETRIQVRNTVPNLFSDLTEAQAASGYTCYRCVYLKNMRTTGTLVGLKVESLRSGNTGSETAVALDTAGVGNGTSTGVATTPASESTAPGFSFTNQITLPNLGPGQTVAIWFRRKTHAGWYKELNPDVHLFLLSGGM